MRLKGFVLAATFAWMGLAAFAFAEDTTGEDLRQSTQHFPTIERSKTVPFLPVKKSLRPATSPKPLVRPFPMRRHTKAANGSETTYLRVPPGVRGVASIDPVSGAVTFESSDENAPQALQIFRFEDGLDARIPDWLEPALAASLLRLPEDQRDRMVYRLTQETDDRLLDEMAFVLAHSSPEDLSNEELYSEVIAENARDIYDMAQNISYAELVEDEETGQTTVRYRLEVDGQPTEWELPPEYYYWFVVHPKLDWERFRWATPKSGRFGPKPNGVFWRDYFSHPANEPPVSHTVHRSMLEPNELHGTAFSGVQVEAALVDFEIGPVVLASRDQDDLPAVTEFVYGNNSTSPHPDGSILATVVPATKMAVDGDTALLENLLLSANNNRTLQTNATYLIVKNRDSYGETPIQTLLDGQAAQVDVVGTAGLVAALNAAEYDKIILAEAQDRAFYQAIADYDEDNADDWENAVSVGRKLELAVRRGACLLMLGAVTEEADRWVGLRMPGGFYAEWPGNSSLTEGGYPSLPDTLAGSTIVWDAVAYPGLSGNRAFDPDTFVLDKIGWWTTQNMLYNISEASLLVSPLERATQPVRISNNHYGNCGELQDMMGAALRTALLPNLSVHNSTDDHVWNTFYLLDGWHPYQVDWSDGPTRIDSNTIAYDTDTGGGGKNCGCIVGTRGDGVTRSVIGDFSGKVTLEVTLTDADGEPVDGAFVLVATEAWGDPNSLTIGQWGTTDIDGRYVTELGNNRNFYLRFESAVGNYPAEDNQVGLVISADEGLDGETFTLEHQFDTSQNDPGFTSPQTRKDDDAPAFALKLTLEDAWVQGINANTGDTVYDAVEEEKRSETGFQAALIDVGDAARFADGEAVEAFATLTEGELVEVGESDAAQKELLLAVANRERYGTELVLALDFENLAQPPADGDEDAPEALEEEGSEIVESTEQDENISGDGNDEEKGGSSSGCRVAALGSFWVLAGIFFTMLLLRRVRNRPM